MPPASHQEAREFQDSASWPLPEPLCKPAQRVAGETPRMTPTHTCLSGRSPRPAHSFPLSLAACPVLPTLITAPSKQGEPLGVARAPRSGEQKELILSPNPLGPTRSSWSLGSPRRGWSGSGAIYSLVSQKAHIKPSHPHQPGVQGSEELPLLHTWPDPQPDGSGP